MNPIALELIKENQKTKSVHLFLDKLDLECIPEMIQDFTWLEHLDLSYNKISKIENLNQLVNLTRLFINHNEIGKIEGLEQLCKLKSLHIRSNQIKKIRGLEKLKNLEILDCSSNQIFEIEDIGNLHKLKILSLNSNQIVKIKNITKLQKLQRLNLSLNQIKNIIKLQKLTNLQYLNLSQNPIQDISPIKQLILNGMPVKLDGTGKGIYIKDCPLKNPPREIAIQGNQAVQNYFQEVKNESSYLLLEAKLLIIGAGGVGKTSLMRKLQNPNNSLTEEEDTTLGITVNQHPTKYKIDNQICTLNIWDFGGQDIYHPTHQFFLTKNSIYILMEDGRERKTDFYYWLQVQELLADTSPLFIIQNIRYNSYCSIPINELKGHFPNIKDYFEIDLAQVKEGYKAFADIVISLKSQLQKLSHMGDLWPETRFKIRKQLIAMKDKNYISLTDFQELCENNNYDSPEAQKEFLHQLHFLGTVLYFEGTPFLDDIVIINPQWVTDAVYAIFDRTKKCYQKRGCFNWWDIKEVWQDKIYKDSYHKLLALMEKFELIFELPNTQYNYIVPLLLPDDKPEYKWIEVDNLRMEYKYDFMPKGILSRLIVRLHPFIKKGVNKTNESYWKRGVIFESDNTLAQVTEDYNGRSLKIAVQGKFPEKLLFKIYTEIDYINKSFYFSERMKVSKLVPCNCIICKEANHPYFFNYKKLTNRQKPYIECLKSEEDINVKSLLSNIQFPGFISQKSILKVFIVADLRDTEYKNALQSQLAILERNNKISISDTIEIEVGKDRYKVITQKIKESDIVVLLLTSNLLSSSDINEKILSKVYEQYKTKDIHVCPVLVKACLWEETNYKDTQMTPQHPEQGIIPITQWKDIEDAWARVSRDIRQIVEKQIS